MMKNLLLPLTILAAILLLAFFPNRVIADPITIQASASASELRPGDELVVSLSTDDPADLYFFSGEIGFDPTVLIFTGAEITELTEGGLAIGDLLRENRAGVSVSRTAPLSSPTSGEFIRLRFRVATYSSTGESLIQIEETTLDDSAQNDLEHTSPEPVTITVPETLSYLSVTSPSYAEIEEGSSYFVTASLFANGVTIDSGNEERIQIWVGVFEENSDPQSWPESAWIPMEFTGTEHGHYLYSADIGFGLATGLHYKAVRAVLDSEGTMQYGGTGGFWSADDNPSAVLDVLQQPPFRYTIAAWDFDDETLRASNALPQNFGAEIELINASFPGSGFVAGASGRAANASNWHNFEEEPAYWLATISTEGLASIQVSSKQSGTNTGPRDFRLEYSIDGETWIAVPGGSITAANNFTTGVLEALPLPEDASNREELQIRWIQTSDIAINENGISATGTNRIDDIIITGINPDPQRVAVWPGDTNNDGVVNEEDVLPLALYWGTSGPSPIYPSIDWMARESEAWIPGDATFADANGDGVINHLDLRPIGIHFGQTRSASMMVSDPAPIAAQRLRTLQFGEEVTFYLTRNSRESLTGLSFHIEAPGIDRNAWEVVEIRHSEWIDPWRDENRLVEFRNRTGSGEAVALARMGFTEPVETALLAEVTIRATENWSTEPEFRITRMAVTANDTSERPESVSIDLDPTFIPDESGIPDQPYRTKLHQNYPNPFNPTTMIRYSLSEPAEVRIDLYNSVGRRVATLIEANQQAGSYTVPFDGSSLSSGIYYYRLRANGQVMMRSMTMIK